MVDRTWWYSSTILRGFDLAWSMRDFMTALAFLAQDTNGATTTVVSGLTAAATAPTSMTINLTAGRIYQLAAVDATAYSVLAADADVIMQQGKAAAQSVVLSTGGLSAGQSRWALVQAAFAPVDAVRTGDPTGGVESYFNVNNPSQPFLGPNNDGAAQPTVRLGAIAVSVIYGTVATSGAEVPPNPSAGNVPLYLIDLAFGQTAVANNQILVSGPSVGANVPSNYIVAPFLAGLLNSHHGGFLGQAPKIQLTNAAEVQGVLPTINIAPPPAGGFRDFTTPGAYSFTVPAGVTMLRKVSGVGGGGGYSGNGGSSGSAAGPFILYNVAVAPGQVITGNIGVAGVANNQPTSGTNGGNTTFAGATSIGGIGGGPGPFPGTTATGGNLNATGQAGLDVNVGQAVPGTISGLYGYGNGGGSSEVARDGALFIEW